MTRFFVTTASARRKAQNAVILAEGSTLLSGVEDFVESFNSEPTSLEADLLRIAAAIFAADRATPRGEREEIGRQIEISVPVTNVGVLLPLARSVEQILRFLSNDGWHVEFRQQSGASERSRTWTGPNGRTLLFSGGLDSLAAALQFSRGTRLQIVSHRTHNTVTSSTQRRLAEALIQRGLVTAHRQFFVSSRSGRGLAHDEENSQRTRAFLFLILGGVCARRTGQRELIYLAENGQMAIHLPLDSSRIGAFSTHTAHPRVLTTMSTFLNAALGVPLTIENPYLYRTKQEVIRSIVDEAPELLPVASSCWRNSRLRPGVTHCGSCVPCQIRRIAIEGCCEDTTAYGRDLWREQIRDLPWTDDGRRNLMELVQFATQFSQLTNEDLISAWPELITTDFDAAQAIDMYKRFAAEAFALWQRYPEVGALL